MNTLKWSLAITALAAVLLIALTTFLYQQSLLLHCARTLPAANCPELEFHYEGVAMGPSVDALVPAFDKTQSISFAVQGRKAVKFKPYKFHSVYGNVEYAPAESQTVYFYTCDKRWLQFFAAP